MTRCYSEQRPYVVIDLLNEQEAILLGSRAICIRSIWEYWADEATYEELHVVNKEKLRYLWVRPSSSPRICCEFEINKY